MNIEEVKERWSEASDEAVIRAAAIDKNGYPPEVRAIIDQEVRQRELLDEVDKVESKLSPRQSSPRKADSFKVSFEKSTGRKIAETIVVNVLVIWVLTMLVMWLGGNFRQGLYGIGAILLLFLNYKLWH